ncbi:MAG: helix-turn-helix transcriptional regulator [Caldilineaceae bacterium]|nr:helix-turn-helix transcriptional regulator [Caldilineaceae bacterium]HRJ43061.1 helix-turn-helix transcriptional regulator [Caldilineaceae bacterium]
MNSDDSNLRNSPESQIRFGVVVRARRKELGLSQEGLAFRSGLHRTYIADIERGSRNISLRSIETLIEALELSFVEFFTRYENQ